MNLDGHILIIDDEASLRQTLARILQRDGYEVTTAASGTEGISIVAQHPFDLVYLDIRMPDMNGLEALKTIHAGCLICPWSCSPPSRISTRRRGAPARRHRLSDEAAQARNGARPHARHFERAAEKEAPPRDPAPDGGTAGRAGCPGTDLPARQRKPRTEPASDRFIKRGLLTLDLHTRRVTINEQTVSLAPTSFDYLLVLVRHSPNVVDYQTLVTEAQGYQADAREAQEIDQMAYPQHPPGDRKRCPSPHPCDQPARHRLPSGHRVGSLQESSPFAMTCITNFSQLFLLQPIGRIPQRQAKWEHGPIDNCLPSRSSSWMTIPARPRRWRAPSRRSVPGWKSLRPPAAFRRLNTRKDDYPGYPDHRHDHARNDRPGADRAAAETPGWKTHLFLFDHRLRSAGTPGLGAPLKGQRYHQQAGSSRADLPDHLEVHPGDGQRPAGPFGELPQPGLHHPDRRRPARQPDAALPLSRSGRLWLPQSIGRPGNT